MHTDTVTVRSISTQVALRLPAELVSFLDRAVAAGRATSRAALVTVAVEREMRRLMAENDAAILEARGPLDDLDDLVAWTGATARVED